MLYKCSGNLALTFLQVWLLVLTSQANKNRLLAYIKPSYICLKIIYEYMPKKSKEQEHISPPKKLTVLQFP